MALHRLTEAAGQRVVQRKVEAGAPAGEVLVELPGGRVESGRRVQDAGAEPARERVEHTIEALPFEGDPHEPLVGGGQQQRADRTVDNGVGDVQQARGIRSPLERAVQLGEPGGVGGGEGDEVARVRFGRVNGGGHRDAPFEASPAGR